MRAKRGTFTHGVSGYVNYDCRCEVCRAAWAPYYAERRRARIARGVCVECKEPSLGFARCAKHRAVQRLREKVYRARRAAAAVVNAPAFMALLLLLCALPASAQEVRLVYPAFVTARVLDLTSTHQALKAGATEINPLMKHPAMRYTLHPLMTVGFVAAAEKARANGKGKRAFWLMVAGTAGQLAIDWNNYRQANNLLRTR
jgi:hypothetical protein